MEITLTPQCRDDMLDIHRTGDVLTINGVAYDFSKLPDGATMPRDEAGCEWIASDVERVGGVLHMTLILPHGGDAPHQTRFPVPITVSQDGHVTLPPYDNDPLMD